PGITTTAAPVFFPVGAYTVIVGRATLVTAVTGLPASNLSLTVAVSGPGTGCGAGAAPGHNGTCACPSAGCQTVVFACAPALASNSPKATTQSFMTIPRRGTRPALHVGNSTSNEIPLADPARRIGPATVIGMPFFCHRARQLVACSWPTQTGSRGKICRRTCTIKPDRIFVPAPDEGNGERRSCPRVGIPG